MKITFVMEKSLDVLHSLPLSLSGALGNLSAISPWEPGRINRNKCNETWGSSSDCGPPGISHCQTSQYTTSNNLSKLPLRCSYQLWLWQLLHQVTYLGFDFLGLTPDFRVEFFPATSVHWLCPRKVDFKIFSLFL